MPETKQTEVREKPMHTPGPWVVGGTWRNSIDEKDKGETTVIYAECIPLARTIWITAQGDYVRSQEQAALNARLIAAAPTLYDALKATSCRYSRSRECDGTEEICDRCAALALVKGTE